MQLQGGLHLSVTRYIREVTIQVSGKEVDIKEVYGFSYKRKTRSKGPSFKQKALLVLKITNEFLFFINLLLHLSWEKPTSFLSLLSASSVQRWKKKK